MSCAEGRPVGSGTLLLLAACGLALAASGARAQSGGGESSRRFSEALATAPERARARQNPMERDPDAVAAGGKLFEQHCAECHGQKANGTRRAPSLLGRAMQQAPAGAIFWVLTNGVVRHGMPVWSKLPEPERWQIVAFLKSLRLPAERKDAENGEASEAALARGAEQDNPPRPPIRNQQQSE